MAVAVLTDIEGTTSSLSFVKEVLFPYSRRHMREFLRAHGADLGVAPLLDEIRAREGAGALDVDGVAAALDRWILEDRKVTPLKTLQGMIWQAGYARGELQGHVYDDAVEALQAWHARGLTLYVYSSGSVEAQRLIFGHTRFGDLTGFFAGFFDTTTGAKLDAASYRTIAAKIGLSPGDVLFLSDNVAELDAARLAGMQTMWLDRDENVHDQAGSSEHPRAETFREIQP
jgi:enolase-phosphatase E1